MKMVNVIEWLEKSFELFPQKIAIMDYEKEYTYSQYRNTAIAVAMMIKEVSTNSRNPIVVFMKKGVDSIAAFAGVLYSNCFYIPIDVDMPEARVKRILQNLLPIICITTRDLKDQVESYGFEGSVICIDDAVDRMEHLRVEEYDISCSDGTDSDLAYVLYTSGSTGDPKGVCIAHRCIIDYIEWVTDTFFICSDDIIGNQAPFYFDNSVLDIYSAMKMGATLCIIPKEFFFQPMKLLNFVKDKKINTIFWVPSVLGMVAKTGALDKIDMTTTLRKVLFAGEVMPNKWLNTWRKHLPDALFANLYGPTEITVDCTYYIVDREFSDDDPLPIGKARRNVEVFILNEQKQVVEPGVIGELCVRGSCLSYGYYKDIVKTESAFIQNPVNENYREYIYCTGDLVKYNEFGELIFVGRKDSQIKKMGNRIELGEIESAVYLHDKTSSCCCLYDAESERILLFVETTLQPAEIKKFLKTLIPDYMIPNKIYCMESLPLNANGKIDRAALKDYYLNELR